MRWPAILLGASLLGVAAGGSSPEADAEVTVHRRGEALEPDRGAAELVRACERQLVTADGALRLAVTHELIASLRAEEVAIEIRYAAPRTFVLDGLGGRTVEADALLIPLGGTFAEGGIATIFVHLGSWRPGPFRNAAGLAELEALIEALGISIGDGEPTRGAAGDRHRR